MQILPTQFKYSEAVAFSIRYAKKKAEDHRNKIIGPNFLLYGLFRALNYGPYSEHEKFKEILEGPNSQSFITEVDEFKSFLEDREFTGDLQYEEFLSILRKLFRIESIFEKNLEGFPSYTEKSFLLFFNRLKIKNQNFFRYDEIKLSHILYHILDNPTFEIEYLINRLNLKGKKFLEDLEKFIIVKSPNKSPSLGDSNEPNLENEEEFSQALIFYNNAKNQFAQYAQKFFNNENRDDIFEVFKNEIENLKAAIEILEKYRNITELQKTYKLIAKMEQCIDLPNYLSHFQRSYNYSKELNLVNEEILLLQILIEENEKNENYNEIVQIIVPFLKKYEENEEIRKSQIFIEFKRSLGHAHYKTGNYNLALPFLNEVLGVMSFTTLNDDYPVLINLIIDIYKKLDDPSHSKHIDELEIKLKEYTSQILEFERLMLDTVNLDVMAYLNLILIQQTATGLTFFVYDRNKSLLNRGIQINSSAGTNTNTDRLSGLFTAFEIFRKVEKQIFEKERWFPFEGQRYYKIEYPEDIGITIFGRIRDRTIGSEHIEVNLKLIADKFIEIYSKEIKVFEMDNRPFRNFVYALKKPILFLYPSNFVNWEQVGDEYAQNLDRVSLKKARDCYVEALKLAPKDNETIKNKIDEIEL